jgi:hypothetical protein
MKRRPRGQVLVIFALALLVLLGFAALGIDVGYMYTVRHELQRSADAGALAGASAFIGGSWSDTGTQALAEERARDFASRDDVVVSPLDSAGEVAVSFPPPDRIRVDTSRTVNLFFSRLFLGPTRTITAYAVAEASVVDKDVPCLKPWGIPFPWNDANGDGIFDPEEGEQVSEECPEGTIDPISGAYCQGTRIVLKIGTPKNKPVQPEDPETETFVPSLQQEPGHFFALDFGSGAKTYKEAIKGNCPDDITISVGDEIPLEPGNMVGPTIQAVKTDPDSLMNRDPTSRWDYDRNLPQSDDPNYAGDFWMNSPRVVQIPIYHPDLVLQQGKSDMPVSGFAGFWIEDAYREGGLQGTVIGRYIPSSAFIPASVSGNNPGPDDTPTLRILRLVE